MPTNPSRRYPRSSGEEMTSRIETLVEVSERVGMSREQVGLLLTRLLQFLILDHVVNKWRVQNHTRSGGPPPSAEAIQSLLRHVGLPLDQLPPLMGLAEFLSAYHSLFSSPNRRVTTPVKGGCSFPVGCPYSDRREADELGVHIEQDHVVPMSRGGGNEPWQFRPLCRPHNQLKGNALFWDESRVLPIRGWLNDG